MVIEYELMTATNRSIRKDEGQPFTDIDSEVKLSFLMSNGKLLDGVFLAEFIGNDTIKKTVKVVNGIAKLPDEMFKPQTVRVTVIEYKGTLPIKRWKCPNCVILEHNKPNKTVCQVVEDYTELPKQLNELEVLYNAEVEKTKNLEKRTANTEAQIKTLTAQLDEKQEDIRKKISADVEGLVKYKELNNAELEKIMKAYNDLAEEVSKTKSEFSL